MEPFKAGQKGSQRDAPQAQPDPVGADRRPRPRCCAATPSTALENQPLWHERDISHSVGGAGDPARRDDPARLHAGEDGRPGRGPGRPAGADAREHRARPGPPRQQPRPGGARRAGRAVARGRLRASSSAPPCAPPTSDGRCASCSRSTPDVARRLPPGRARRLLRRRRASSATCPPSSPGSTALEAAAPMPSSLTRSSAPARSATCTPSATTGCCSSRPTGSARSTSSCRRRSPTRAAS